MRDKQRARRVALSGMLVALMLIMGYIESLIPMGTGIPGVKPGLSNGVLVFAVYLFDIPLTFCLMILKVLLTGMMFGGISAMLYSLSGGVLSLTVMVLLRRLTRLKPEFIGMAGGMFHNIGQTAMAMIVLRTGKLMGYLAVLIPVGICCGLLTGFLADLVTRQLKAAGKLPERSEDRRGIGALLIAALLMAAALWLIFTRSENLRPRGNDPIEVEWGAPGIQITEIKRN